MKGRFDWKAAYFNLVSLVAMIFFLFAAVSAGQGLLRMLLPSLSMDSYQWETVESFEAYKRQNGETGPKVAPRPGPDAVDTTSAPRKTDAELRTEWEEHRRLAVEGEKRRGLWIMLQSLATIVVAVPVLLFHRRQVKRLKEEAEPQEIA